jgi:transposase
MIDRHWNGIALSSQSDNQVSPGVVEGPNNKTCVIQRGVYGLRDEDCA